MKEVLSRTLTQAITVIKRTKRKWTIVGVGAEIKLRSTMEKVYPLCSSSVDSSLSESLSQNEASSDISQESLVNSSDEFTRPLIVCVEGNIGCGKSTLLNYFDKDAQMKSVPEPIDKWTNLNGHNLLGNFYQDASRHSYSFNSYASLTRVQMHQTTTMKPMLLLERSLYSTRYCFVENGHKTGVMHDMEYGVLDEWFQFLVKRDHVPVDLFVYVRADPQKCFQRLCRRNRKEEALIPFKLIEDLHARHDEWLIHNKFPLPAPVLVLDANPDLADMEKTYEANRAQIMCGVNLVTPTI